MELFAIFPVHEIAVFPHYFSKLATGGTLLSNADKYFDILTLIFIS